MPKHQSFAVFDIDGTLVRWQMMHAIINQLARDNCLGMGDFDRIRHERMIWKNRAHAESFRAYEKAVIQIYLEAIKAISTSDYDRAVDTVFNEYKDQTYVYTRQLIKKLKSQGYFLVTISGSQSEIVARIAEYYGFDVAVGCMFERKANRFTGEYTTPVFEKGVVLHRLINEYGLHTAGSIAIGDSESDVPLFEICERAITFNPTRALFETAHTNAWEVVVERKNVTYEMHMQDGQYVLA